MVRLGILSIGQAPHPTLADGFGALLPDVQLVQHGVLDGLTLAEIEALAPAAPGENVLTTDLPSGTTVVVAEHHVVDRLPAAVAALEEHADVTFLACTGEFAPIPHRKPFFTPHELLSGGTLALAGRADVLGVLCPLPEQAEFARQKYQALVRPGVRVVVADASPYTSGPADVTAAAARLRAAGAGIVALDCMGYDDSTRALVTQEVGVPVVVARTVAARLMAEVLDSYRSVLGVPA
ncbi:MAG TPA: AroM family protein [Cellulomonas sp.]